MSLSVWPDIKSPDYGFSDKSVGNIIRSDKEAGYKQTRSRFTQVKKEFSFGWKKLPEQEYQTLDAFFIQNQGTAFSWTHPITGIDYTVGFAMDELEGKAVQHGYRSVSVKLEER